MAPARFFNSPPWRWVVTELDGTVVTFLDHLAMDRIITYRLNDSALAECRVPSDNPEVNILQSVGTMGSEPFVSEGDKLLFCFRRENPTSDPVTWVVRFAGILMQIEDEAASDERSVAYSHLTAFDPWEYMNHRPVRSLSSSTDTGLPGEDGLSFTATDAGVIAATLLRNTIVEDGDAFIDAGATYAGTGFYTGTIEPTVAIDINFQQGCSVGEAWSQLVELDVLDIVLTPIWDPINRPGYCVQMNIYPQAGEAQDEAIFAWDEPSHSLVGITRLQDGAQRSNVVFYRAGMGGVAGAAAIQEDMTSISRYREYWRQQFYPKQSIVSAVEALAQSQLQLTKNGKETVTISPAPERAPLVFQEYFLGDRVPVYASSNLREALAGYQRIYGIPLMISDDGVEEVRQMLTSAQP